MSEFEYLAVFASIIFGISVAHILSGAIRLIYRGRRDETHFVLTGFLFLVMVLNWWTGFSWDSEEAWSFDLFLIIILWSVSHYIAAITLYPPFAASAAHHLQYRRAWFLWAFIGVVATDILQTAARGALLTPWYYLPFVLHYAVLSLVAIFTNKPAVYRWIARYFLLSIAVWAFVVRRFIA